jgi:hypothetical protein
MTCRRLVLVLVMSVALCLPGTLAGQTHDPWFGTWRLDVEKSRFRPGQAPRSIVTTIEPLDGGLKYSSDAVNARGETTHIEGSASFNGRDRPVHGDPEVDSVALKRINSQTYEIVMKKAGKVTANIINVISRDGKLRTATAIWKNAQLTEGSNIKEVVVFERQ